jgi:hypothetical protein
MLRSLIYLCFPSFALLRTEILQRRVLKQWVRSSPIFFKPNALETLLKNLVVPTNAEQCLTSDAAELKSI